jgi:hypothetical protein
MELCHTFAHLKGTIHNLSNCLLVDFFCFDKIYSVKSLQDNVVARPLNDAHLATPFNFKGLGL